MSTLKEYMVGIKEAHAELDLPEPDPYTCSMLADAWHKATKTEQKRCVSRSLAAASAVLQDLRDRDGLRQEWERIDLPTQMEIVNAWKDAIANAIKE